MKLRHGDKKIRMTLRMAGFMKYMSLSALALLAIPLLAGAAQVNNVSLMDSASGDVVRVEADSSLEYQVFDLQGPPRVVVNFPGAKIGGDVKAIKVDGEGVTGVFPESSDKGVRLEIGLSDSIGYKIEESGNNLIIKFAKAEEAAGSTAAAVIKDIEVRESGATTELILRGENMDANHNAFLSNQNKTLILDFWGGASNLPKEHYQYATQRVSGVTVGEADGRVRLVVDLIPTGKVSQQISAQPGQMVVRIGSVEAGRRDKSIVVESVDFQPDDRIAHIQVRTDAVNPIVNLNEKEGSVVIDIKKAHLAEGMERSQDVRAFPGPIKQIDSYGVNDSVRIVARLRGKVDVTTFQQGNVVTVNFEPEDLRLERMGAAADGSKALTYSGQNVTFDFKDIEITNALKLISEMSDLNIIMSDDVKGSVSMRLVDVPWDQALDIILSSQGLGKEIEGNVMRIAPLDVLRKEHKAELEGLKDVEMLEPLITEPIALNFARVEEVDKMLDATRKSTSGGSASDGGEGSTSSGSTSILSPRGSYLVDQRTNTLIVTDTEQSINNVKRFVSIVDRTVEQVLIEARIVEATSTFTEEFGIRWGGMYNDTTKYNFPNTVAVGGAGGAGAVNGMIVDMPAPSAGPGAGAKLGISLGSFSNIINLDLELSAAEIDGLAKVVSSPRVLTANGGKALISQGVDVPFVTPASGTSPATVSFKKAELKLEVSPQITANKTVIMGVDITNDAPTGQTVQGNPILATKKVTTNLQVKDGETIVIGGVFTKSTADNESGVPGLKDIPLIGYLFKTKQNLNNKTELLIFLTPKIINTAGRGDIAAGKI